MSYIHHGRWISLHHDLAKIGRREAENLQHLSSTCFLGGIIWATYRFLHRHLTTGGRDPNDPDHDQSDLSVW